MENRFLKRLPVHPRIIYMGTPDFAVAPLVSLVDAGYEVSCVVTRPDRRKGRGRKPAPSPVKMAAGERGLEVLQPESVNLPEFHGVLEGRKPDLIVVVAFGQILKGALLSMGGWGIVNIHASLLPLYRGPAPIQWAILNDEPRTGLTLMRMDQGLDTGPVLFQQEMEILPDETAGSLHDRMSATAGGFLVRSLEALCEAAVETPQDEAEATYAPKITREMTLVDWDEPARRVCGRIRALDPVPGARTTFRGEPLKLFSASRAGDTDEKPVPGRVIQQEGRLIVETGEGLVAVGEVQAAGRRRMACSDFLRGFDLPAGSRLGT
ncbi:MAG: methionyl-tRNA formyltransferase [Thermodesulfobacteriota bacterium]